jgi:HAD superfamily hydrolase (TIGR01456 family)
MKAAKFGIVFDIDGVLMKSDKAIPEARGALDLLHSHPDWNIPYVFATNHGGTPEHEKATILAKQFNLPIETEQMLLSHTPMKQLLPLYQNKLVLVVGQTKELTDTIMRAYGYQKWVYFQDFIAARPNILPLLGNEVQKDKDQFAEENIAAVFVMHEPHNWMEGLQLLCDVLLSDGKVTNAGYKRAEEKQEVELFIANGDFSYSASFNQPRITAGAFTLCLQALYKQYCGRDLKLTVYGKPGIEYHHYAETMLRDRATASRPNSDIQTIYMIGDNPKSDIQGANAAGDHWFSILVRTGLFKGENDDTHPAKHVVDTVYDAIQFICQREGIHL